MEGGKAIVDNLQNGLASVFPLFLVDYDVLGFDVPMHDAVFLQIIDSF